MSILAVSEAWKVPPWEITGEEARFDWISKWFYWQDRLAKKAEREHGKRK